MIAASASWKARPNSSFSFSVREKRCGWNMQSTRLRPVFFAVASVAFTSLG